ncbi:hypothetical protein BD626DRAFT_541363 [Schizophyllum amplum]|uniref:Uncharacterized protein n=1 Tax=Schizophyllum amplum TaxID=97359 RepID=A0A550BV10_9AGAR|nr:hypothetical protein BD626DRAFT_541363 [Auriculariopsis ampla]
MPRRSATGAGRRVIEQARGKLADRGTAQADVAVRERLREPFVRTECRYAPSCTNERRGGRAWQCSDELAREHARIRWAADEPIGARGGRQARGRGASERRGCCGRESGARACATTTRAGSGACDGGDDEGGRRHLPREDDWICYEDGIGTRTATHSEVAEYVRAVATRMQRVLDALVEATAEDGRTCPQSWQFDVETVARGIETAKDRLTLRLAWMHAATRFWTAMKAYRKYCQQAEDLIRAARSAPVPAAVSPDISAEGSLRAVTAPERSIAEEELEVLPVVIPSPKRMSPKRVRFALSTEPVPRLWPCADGGEGGSTLTSERLPTDGEKGRCGSDRLLLLAGNSTQSSSTRNPEFPWPRKGGSNCENASIIQHTAGIQRPQGAGSSSPAARARANNEVPAMQRWRPPESADGDHTDTPSQITSSMPPAISSDHTDGRGGMEKAEGKHIHARSPTDEQLTQAGAQAREGAQHALLSSIETSSTTRDQEEPEAIRRGSALQHEVEHSAVVSTLYVVETKGLPNVPVAPTTLLPRSLLRPSLPVDGALLSKASATEAPISVNLCMRACSQYGPLPQHLNARQLGTRRLTISKQGNGPAYLDSPLWLSRPLFCALRAKSNTPSRTRPRHATTPADPSGLVSQQSEAPKRDALSKTCPQRAARTRAMSSHTDASSTLRVNWAGARSKVRMQGNRLGTPRGHDVRAAALFEPPRGTDTAGGKITPARAVRVAGRVAEGMVREATWKEWNRNRALPERVRNVNEVKGRERREHRGSPLKARGPGGGELPGAERPNDRDAAEAQDIVRAGYATEALNAAEGAGAAEGTRGSRRRRAYLSEPECWMAEHPPRAVSDMSPRAGCEASAAGCQ